MIVALFPGMAIVYGSYEHHAAVVDMWHPSMGTSSADAEWIGSSWGMGLGGSNWAGWSWCYG